MWIMTKDGWKPLQFKSIVTIEQDDGRYRGPIPSAACLAFIAKIQQDIAESKKFRLGAAAN